MMGRRGFTAADWSAACNLQVQHSPQPGAKLLWLSPGVRLCAVGPGGASQVRPADSSLQNCGDQYTGTNRARLLGQLTRPPVIVSRSGVKCTVELLSAAEKTTPNSRRTRLHDSNTKHK